MNVDDTRETYAESLKGRTLQDGWHVDQLVKNTEQSGGYNSVSYLVSRPGEEGFLKAYDLEAVLRRAQSDPDFTPIAALNTLTAFYMFERDLLNECGRMDRIINIVGSGEIFIDPTVLSSFVPYIICERANCDIRTTLSRLSDNDVGWRLKTLHHVATAIAQLHSHDIAHRDIKQANVLETNDGRKICDLGSATRRGVAGPHNPRHFPGDIRYAPPEVVYGYEHPDWILRCLPLDLFALGNITSFVFTKLSMCNLIMFKHLAEPHRAPLLYGGSWKGSFEELKPYLIEAFAKSLDDVGNALPPPPGSFDYRPPLIELMALLTHPDPAERGLRDRRGHRSLSLQSVIAQLNLLEKRTLVRRRGVA